MILHGPISRVAIFGCLSFCVSNVVTIYVAAYLLAHSKHSVQYVVRYILTGGNPSCEPYTVNVRELEKIINRWNNMLYGNLIK